MSDWTPESGQVPPSAQRTGEGLACALVLAMFVLAFIAIVLFVIITT